MASDQFDELILLGQGLPLPESIGVPVHEIVSFLARSAPGNIAIEAGGSSVSYQVLDAWADALAKNLRGIPVRRESRVAVLAKPSAAMIAAVLGILRCGAAYVPLESAHPDARLAELLADAQVSAVVLAGAAQPPPGWDGPVLRAEDVLKALALPGCENTLPPVQVEPGDAAYLIHTSGTTGEAKGVVVEHGHLAASTLARRSVYPGPATFLLVSPLAFDSSAAGIWGTLTSGGRLVIASADEVLDPASLVSLIHQHSVTQLLCVPSLYRVILDAADRLGADLLRSLQTVVVAGEPLPQALLERHFAATRGVSLVNEYGPTETTVWASYQRFDEPGPVSIGGPVPGARLYVLDDEHRLAPREAIGELAVGGVAVARGYHGRPEATAQVFLPDPFDDAPGARVYLTGDLVRWNGAGRLEFVGRRDLQVKVRGRRIELGAAESGLRSAPGVQDATVVPDGQRTNLVAFLIAASGVSVPAIRSHLAATMPPELIPAHIEVLPEFPLTTNGKVDRARLAALAEKATPTAQADDTPPGRAPEPGPAGAFPEGRDDTLGRVAAAWSAVLDRPDIPTEVNFFELGGHSLALFQLQDALETHTGVRPSVVDLFRHTTIVAQTAAVRGSRTQAPVIGPGTGQATTQARALQARRERMRRRSAAAGSAVTDGRPAAHVPATEGSSPVLGDRSGRWLQCNRPEPGAQFRMVCFPHAGGSASFFRGWERQLPGIEVHAVCYPGRGERIDEPPPNDLCMLAGQIAEAVFGLVGVPLVLFGHSLGAAVALETARALEAAGRGVAHLFASGSKNAPRQEMEIARSAGGDDTDDDGDTLTRLLELGGMDANAVADPAFQDLVLPYVRADSRMFHNYVLRPGSPLPYPVTTIVGDVDIHADLRPWRELTTGAFREEVVQGNHFYLIEAPPFALIQESLAHHLDLRSGTDRLSSL